MLTAILADELPQKLSSFWLPQQASTVSGSVDGLYDFIYYLSLFFFLLITFLVIWFIIKYRHRENGTPHEPAAGHSTALELTWTIIPTIIVLVIFYYGFRGFINMMVEPPNSYEVDVTGRMWAWSFTYPGGQIVSNELHIPVNTPIRFVTTSEDVIHSLFLPYMRVKRDVVPGRYNRFWVQATEVGEFPIYCAEYCGQNHSQMLTKVIVHTPEDFKRWLIEASDWTPRMSPIAAGEMLYKTRGCTQCHSIDGTIIIGPSFKDMFGSTVATDKGSIVADENYVRESIEYPQAKIHQGFPNPSPMPSFLGSINDRDMGAIIGYMKSISVNFKGDLAPFKVVGKKSTTGPSSSTTTQPAAAKNPGEK